MGSATTLEQATGSAHQVHSVHPHMECEPWKGWQPPAELEQQTLLRTHSHGRAGHCADQPCSSAAVIAYQPGNTMRNGYVPVLEADHKEAVHRGQRLPAAASMAHGLCREAACRRDALCSSSPVPAAAQCSMPEGQGQQLFENMTSENNSNGAPRAPDSAQTEALTSTGCPARVAVEEESLGGWDDVHDASGTDGGFPSLGFPELPSTQSRPSACGADPFLLQDSGWLGIDCDPVDSMLLALAGDAPQCAATSAAPSAEECARLFGSRTCWARGQKPCEALEGLTMIQIVELAAKFPWPPANITDPAVRDMCFARVLVDFWHPENLVGQRAAGGGYFRRTLDSHGYPECECMRRNAAKCDSGCRRWQVKVELALCRNLFLKRVVSWRKQAVQPRASSPAGAGKRTPEDVGGSTAAKRPCAGLDGDNVEAKAGPRLPEMRVHFDTPIGPDEGRQVMAELREMAEARGWQLKVYLACIEVQFVATPSGTCAEVAAMDLLAQLCGSCTSAFLQIGAKRAMQWTPGQKGFISVEPPMSSARMSSTWLSENGWVMVAVTCTAEDEAEVIMWRDGHGCDDAADDVDGPTKMELGEPAMQQSVEEPGRPPVEVTLGAASTKHSEIRRLKTHMQHRLEDGGVILAVHDLSPADADVTVLQLRLGRMLLDTCDVPPLPAARGASPPGVDDSSAVRDRVQTQNLSSDAAEDRTLAGDVELPEEHPQPSEALTGSPAAGAHAHEDEAEYVMVEEQPWSTWAPGEQLSKKRTALDDGSLRAKLEHMGYDDDDQSEELTRTASGVASAKLRRLGLDTKEPSVKDPSSILEAATQVELASPTQVASASPFVKETDENMRLRSDMRERNRIAQKRYRMRQREKLEEARAEIAALKQQLAEATLKQQLADATAAQMQSRLVSDRAESVAPSATTATNTELRAGGEASSADPVPEHHRPLPWGTAPEETASAIRGQQVPRRVDALGAVLVERSDGSNWQLGAGSLGKVYKAVWRGTTEAAVKMLHCEVDSAAEQRVMALYDRMSNLGRHDNIVQLFAVCPAVDNDPVMLCTEFMEGGDLRTALWKDNLEGTCEWDWRHRGRSACINIAECLEFLHRERIVHSDVKSSNVLLTRDGAAKLADLGLAAAVNQRLDLHRISVGHFACMAPEVLLGTECTYKVDVFSFGVLLWEIVTGEPPQRGNLRALDVPGECPAEVVDLIDRCIQADPEQRPDMSEVLEALLTAPAAKGAAVSRKDSHLRRAPVSAAGCLSAATAATSIDVREASNLRQSREVYGERRVQSREPEGTGWGASLVSPPQKDAAHSTVDEDSSKVKAAPSARPDGHATVNVLLQWLLPRLPNDKQEQIEQAKAAYAAGSDQPDARQRLVAAIHSIAGREVIMDFYDREGQAQGGSAGSSAGLEHGVDDRTAAAPSREGSHGRFASGSAATSSFAAAAASVDAHGPSISSESAQSPATSGKLSAHLREAAVTDRGASMASSPLEGGAIDSDMDVQVSKVKSEPTTRGRSVRMVNTLLDWLMPRLPDGQREQLKQAQAAYAADTAQPDARQRLIDAVHSITGYSWLRVVKDFCEQTVAAQAAVRRQKMADENMVQADDMAPDVPAPSGEARSSATAAGPSPPRGVYPHPPLPHPPPAAGSGLLQFMLGHPLLPSPLTAGPSLPQPSCGHPMLPSPQAVGALQGTSHVSSAQQVAATGAGVGGGASQAARLLYPAMSKTLGSFTLHVDAGEFTESEIVVMLGGSGTGKTMFLRMLAGVLKPDHIAGDLPELNVRFKPQKLAPKFAGTVRELLHKHVRDACGDPTFTADVMRPMQVDVLLDREVRSLSGGELQRVAITMCLGRPSDVYLIDEPSTDLDSEERIVVAKVIKRFITGGKKTAFIAERDLVMAAFLADRVIAYEGQPSVEAYARSPQPSQEGLNMFLENLGSVVVRGTWSNAGPMVAALLEFLAPRLTDAKKQTQTIMAQASYAADCERPDARERLISDLHRIAGHQLVQEFSNQKKHAQASLAEESVLRDQLLHMSEDEAGVLAHSGVANTTGDRIAEGRVSEDQTAAMLPITGGFSRGTSTVSSPPQEDVGLGGANRDGSKVIGAASTRSDAGAMATALLEFLRPRLTDRRRQTQIATTGLANHAPVSRHPAGPQPAALMERHIAALHRIAGRQLALEFYDQEGRAQAWPAQYALLQRQLPYLSLDRTAEDGVAYTIFPCNLPDDFGEDQLRELFAGCGRIVAAKLLPSPQGGPTGSGYVSFFKQADAIRAQTAVNGQRVQRRAVQVPPEVHEFDLDALTAPEPSLQQPHAAFAGPWR